MLAEPEPQGVGEMAASLTPGDWTFYAIEEGSQGPIVAEFALRRGSAGWSAGSGSVDCIPPLLGGRP